MTRQRRDDKGRFIVEADSTKCPRCGQERRRDRWGTLLKTCGTQACLNFCLRGHDKRIVGVTVRKQCVECHKMTEARYSAAKRARKLQAKMESQGLERAGLPAFRLRRIIHTQENAAFLMSRYRPALSWTSCTTAAYRLWNAEAVTVDTADVWCLAAGESLIVVYPEAYERGVA